MKYLAFIFSVLIIAGGLVFAGCASSSEARIKGISKISGEGKLEEAKLSGIPTEEYRKIHSWPTDSATPGNLLKFHVIFKAESYVFKYNDKKPVMYYTDKSEIYEIGDKNGSFMGGGWVVSKPMFSASLRCSVYFNCKVSDTCLDFICLGKLQDKDFKEQFTDAKWGDRVSCSVQKGDWLMWTFIEPRLCLGCDKCTKDNTKDKPMDGK